MKRFKILPNFIDKHLYLSYSIGFIMLYTIANIPFEIKDGIFSFRGFFSEPSHYFDSLKQHIIFMYDYVKDIKTFLMTGRNFPLYQFDIGFGGDLITSYGYYSLFDPLTIIAYIIPLSKIGLSYFIIMSLRVYLSGLFMILLAKKLGIMKFSSLITVGFIYAFSSPIMYSTFRHPFFINGPMYLPLLMFGAELIIEKKSPLLFIFTVFFSAISQFYFFVYVVIGFAVYLIFRLIDELKLRNYRMFLLIILYALIGSLMASFVLYPTILALLEGSRTESKGLVFFTVKEILSIIRAHLIPIRGSRYSNGIGNIFLLFSSFLYLFDKKSPHKFIKWSFLIFFLLGFVSIFSFIVNGFTYVNNRWLFIIMVPVSLSFGFLIDGQIRPSLSNYKKTYIIIYPLLLLAIYISIIEFLNYIKLDISLVLVTKVFLIILIIFLIFKKILNPRIPLWIRELFLIKNYLRIVLSMSICTIISASIYYSLNHCPKNGFEIYYPNVGSYQDLFRNDSFYRVEHRIHDANFDKYSNDNLRYGFKSTYQYNSMANGHIVDYFNSLEIINLNGTTGYNGLEGRSILLALNQVRYYIIRESEKTLPPYGFKYIMSVNVPKYNNKNMGSTNGNLEIINGVQVYEKAHIYENQNLVNFGYMVYESIDTNTFESLDYLNKQNALLNYVVLDDGKKASIDELKPGFVTIANDIKVVDNEYRFTIPKIKNHEVYVLVEGLIQENHRRKFTVTYETKDVHLRDTNSPIGSNTYKDNQTQLANLGYYEYEENLEVTIKFSDGIYNIEKISYGLLETNRLDSTVETLNSHTLKNLQFYGNGFTGTIDTPKDGYLIISLPYSSGFTARIDRVDVEVLKANIGFMTIKVPAGHHEISFTYMTPGLSSSLLISKIAFVSTILIGVYHVIRKKKYIKIKQIIIPQ